MRKLFLPPSTRSVIKKRMASIAIFVMLGALLIYEEPTIEIAWVTAILLLTIYLFAFEVVDVDIAAITIMVVLGLTSLFAPIMGLEQGLVDTAHLFDGFSSNAVVSIIAVMIIGAGLDKTGIMSKVANFILNVGGTSEKRIIPIISGTVAFISSFMQNVGAAALFLPVVSRISSRAKLPMSRLLMPMGFCAILGGTVTMIGSSPLILLNDLILTSNSALDADQQMQTWSLFSVTPVGISLVITGILYFVIFGRFVLPVTKIESSTSSGDTMSYFHDVYGVDYDLYEVVVPDGSDIIGKRLDDFEDKYQLRVIATKLSGHSTRIGPGALDRDTGLSAGMVLGITAEPEYLDHFIQKYNLKKRSQLRTFAEDLATNKAGIAEIVIPPSSKLIGKSARDVWMRKTYGISMITMHRDGHTMREVEDIRNIPFHSGDTLVVHTTWEALMRLEKDSNFVVITSEYPHEELRPNKVLWAGIFFAIALSLVLFTDIRLSIALLTGAIGMVLSGVLRIDEAYDAVSWKTVFLLASLIPLGMAVEQTGTAKWIAEQTLLVVGDMPIWVVQAAMAVLATFFTLVMSNVGATVLLVPLAVNIAIGVGANPALFALTVAIATSNSFLIPTHQVNALIMGPGGYRVPDFMRAGGIMTVLFLIVSVSVLNLLY
ncbi:MAG: SLC13 family permease [Gammaproteobacteria bacterium]|nr:SLC13 family permease [Gammaproteobacteria bacterium]NNC67935.1 SLC13 family permease [Gammaproteobacteria bacterium]